MNKKDKLLRRLYDCPKDFTFNELVSLFGAFGFTIDNKGNTSGSRVAFVNESMNLTYIVHKPHPSNVVKGYVIKQVIKFLKANGITNKKEQEK